MPELVSRRIEERAAEVGFPVLKRAAAAMSEAYRDGRTAALARLPAAERVAAYMVTRMPATYAAAHAALREIRQRVGAVSTVLAIGAGTGGASLAARHWFPGAAVTMIERDRAMAEMAREWLSDAQVLVEDLTRLTVLPPHDLVMAAYSLGEFGRPAASRPYA